MPFVTVLSCRNPHVRGTFLIFEDSVIQIWTLRFTFCFHYIRGGCGTRLDDVIVHVARFKVSVHLDAIAQDTTQTYCIALSKSTQFISQSISIGSEVENCPFTSFHTVDDLGSKSTADVSNNSHKVGLASHSCNLAVNYSSAPWSTSFFWLVVMMSSLRRICFVQRH